MQPKTNPAQKSYPAFSDEKTATKSNKKRIDTSSFLRASLKDRTVQMQKIFRCKAS
jgi:hypothetical protein